MFDDFSNDLFNELDILREQTLGCILDQLASFDKSKNPSYFLKEAKEILNSNWDTLEGRLYIANGKDLISTINAWMRSRYKRSCSRAKLIAALTPTDIPVEMKDVIDMLENP